MIKKRIVRPDAIAEIRGGIQAPGLRGEVLFFQNRSSVTVSVNISGLPYSESGFFGFHIHDGVSCTGEGFSDTGGHYNPKGRSHPSHSGDLPPLLKCNGGAYMTVMTDRFTVNEIIDKTVVIHNMPDDLTTQPSGNSGTKIACGVIRGV
ncbi:MAG: superoxide dismutase family protein [Clostridia bacterium]|nr:superoxide dismutase family protein [Clostridia bacterium]